MKHLTFLETQINLVLLGLGALALIYSPTVNTFTEPEGAYSKETPSSMFEEIIVNPESEGERNIYKMEASETKENSWDWLNIQFDVFKNSNNSDQTTHKAPSFQEEK